jgi:hypothetical protein
MKVLAPVLLALVLAGCTNTIATHQDDFSPPKKKGPWNDYYHAVKKGEEPKPPKEPKQ